MEDREFVRAEARSRNGEFVVAVDQHGGQWVLPFDDPRLAGVEIGPYEPDTEGVAALAKKDVVSWALENGFDLGAMESFIKDADRNAWLDWEFDGFVARGSRLARILADYLGFYGDDEEMFREIMMTHDP